MGADILLAPLQMIRSQWARVTGGLQSAPTSQASDRRFERAPGLPHAAARESVRRLGTEVIPAIRATLGENRRAIAAE